MGKTTQKHYAIGYQNAMADITAIMANGGNLESILEWVENNTSADSAKLVAQRIEEFRSN